MVELFRSERFACHLLGGMRGHHTTVPEHMPSAHRRYAGWTHERILRDACAAGLIRAGHCRAGLGILRLGMEVEKVSSAVRRGVSRNGKVCSEDHPQRLSRHALQ
jgi:hypothetical protein